MNNPGQGFSHCYFFTVKVATPAVMLLPRLVCNAPAGIVLVRAPLQFLAVTITVTVQEPFAGIEPPVNVIDELP
jgi:hypothetical protein